MNHFDQRGFALVESLGSLGLAAVALVAGLTLVYFGFAHTWLKRVAYKTSICLSTPMSSQQCERELRASVESALPVGRLQDVLLTRGRASVKTQFRWSLNSGLVLAVEDARSVPLLGRVSR